MFSIQTLTKLIVAVSCAELIPPPHAQISISGGVAEVVCDSNGATQTMQCIGNRWVGEIEECPSGKLCYYVWVNLKELHVPYNH